MKKILQKIWVFIQDYFGFVFSKPVFGSMFGLLVILGIIGAIFGYSLALQWIIANVSGIIFFILLPIALIAVGYAWLYLPIKEGVKLLKKWLKK